MLEDCSTLREKTEKIGMIARAAAIFAVTKVCIYGVASESKDETRFLKLILEYLELPQYLRKKVYPISEDLRFAGLLPPLRIPSHLVTPDESKVRVGDIRDGIAVRKDGKLFADVGLRNYIILSGNAVPNQRVTVRIESVGNGLSASIIERSSVGIYWGYSVKAYSSLRELFNSLKPAFAILTSRKGDNVQERWNTLTYRIGGAQNTLAVFGSPKHGLPEILERERFNPPNSVILNTIPKQAVETVRTEEAIVATLAILNLART
jgi:predicted SPOUT superfamily RNA methylase MTH1